MLGFLDNIVNAIIAGMQKKIAPRTFTREDFEAYVKRRHPEVIQQGVAAVQRFDSQMP